MNHSGEDHVPSSRQNAGRVPVGGFFRFWKGKHEAFLMVFLTLVYGFLIATALCPVMPEGGFDSTLFLLTSKGWLSGLLPYRDLFEHKGPVLYALEALAMLPLRSSVMVWGMEVLFFFASLCLLRSMARMEKASLTVRCLTYVSYTMLLATCLEKGNFSEEYCLLFTLLGFWALFHATVKGFRVWTGAVMGTAFALLFWIRPNNALPMCCAIIALVIVLLGKKQFRQLATLALTGFGAAILITLVIIVYFYANGALGDMLDTCFTFNVWYTKQFAQARSFGGLFSTYFGRYSMISLGVCLSGAVYVLLGRKRERLRLLTVTVGTIVALMSCWLSSNPFFHYFIIVMPTLALGLMYFFRQMETDVTQLWHGLRAHHVRFSLKSLSRIPPLLLALYCGTVLAHHATGTFIQAKREPMSVNISNRLGALSDVIPADEYDETLVIATDNLILWYEVYDQLPIKKYYFGYDYISRADASREKEIVNQFSVDPPKWVLINAGEAKVEPTQSILSDHYTLTGVHEKTQLYRLMQ